VGGGEEGEVALPHLSCPPASSAPGISPSRSDANDNSGREDLTAGTAPSPVNGGLEQAGGGESGPQIHATSEAANSTTLLTPLRAHYHRRREKSPLVGGPDTSGSGTDLSSVDGTAGGGEAANSGSALPSD
jgi:hypothetical protein